MEKEIGHKFDMEEVKEKLRKNFEKVFDVEIVLE
jgi:lipoyl(octanoyl) transferase